MPQFFFHVTDHRVVIDQSGLDLASPEDARAEACRRVCRLLVEDPAFWSGGRWHLAVTDIEGRTAFSISANIRVYDHSTAGA